MSNNPLSKKKTTEDKPKEGKKAPRFPIWIYVVLFLILIGFNFYFVPGESSERIKYSEFLNFVDRKSVV